MTTVGRWSPNKVRARVLDGTWVSPEELGGMVLLTPSSVDITGGGSETATTLANGSVEFTACGTVSLNGVFSADYDNYMVSIRQDSSSATSYYYRLRDSGSDNSTANSYVSQYLYADNTTVAAARVTTDKGLLGYLGSVLRNGLTLNIYGPYLAQPSAWRTVWVDDLSNARTYDVAGTHNQSTAYDGFTLIPTAGTITGLVSVFGLVGA